MRLHLNQARSLWESFEQLAKYFSWDLSDLPPVPSLFAHIPDDSEIDPRRSLMFLNHVVGEISQPIARDDRVHINYVPTQVVTEYFRTRTLPEGIQIDGVMNQSAVHPGRSSAVLFATQASVSGADSDEDPSEEPWLELVNVSEATVSAERIRSWREFLPNVEWFGEE